MLGQSYSNSARLWKHGGLTKVLGFVVGGLFAIFAFARPEGYGWAGASLMAAAAVTIPTLQYRKLWNHIRFWVTVFLLAAIQVPLVVAVHRMIDQRRSASLLAFGIVDGLFVIAFIFFVCSED